MVKQAVITYSYNASHLTMIQYIKDVLDSYSTNTGKKDEIVYFIKGESKDVYLTTKDISYFVKCFATVIKKVFPRMEQLKIYITTIVKICTRLKAPVPWALPSGAVVSQSYLDSKVLKIRPFAFINSKYSFRTIIKDEFSLSKQINAAMPNLIHSLDASSIALLYRELGYANINHLYTIHDCFAVTADNVEILINTLKGVYIQMYSDDLYLLKLDNHIRSTIYNSFGPKVFDLETNIVTVITPDQKKIKLTYPSLKNVIDYSSCVKCLKESSNIIT